MTGKYKMPGLFEFLEEAELQQYYNGLKNILQVHNVPQLKYVVEDDLFSIGMSKPEARRLRTFYHKHCPQNYASKLKRLLRPKSKDESKHEFLLGEEAASDFSTSNRSIKVPSQHIIPADSISIYKELGAGEFGVVQQGVWTDDDQMRHQVAVKCLSKERMQTNTLEFMKEYDIMQAIDHPNIVRLYGVVLDSAQIMLITELAPLRSLLECLKEQSLRTTFTVTCLANFCIQICEGMKYLEQKRLIHRDLAARNILVFSKSNVKVSDFGLSRALGVGKDYYQTNFNVNLKLPIAWCAPECINFLKFTSASDVWAFGVTMWEMFSYGFQPWAAQTGQQILEAIDEPNSQRLEQPVHCPREYYGIMHQTWRHEPSKRPTFAELVPLLEDAKPEQVQAVTGTMNHNKSMLDFEVGDVVTVLDKHNVTGSSTLWSGALNNGKVGLFSPTHTVAYLGTLPSAGNHGRWQNEELYQSMGTFQRSSLRGSKGSQRKKLSRDMISEPRGDVRHTGHVGADGAFFGDVTFIPGKSDRHSTLPSLSSWQSAGGDSMQASLTRADSDVSERAPLITRGFSESSSTSLSSAGANKNPRMGYAIGYLRRSSQDHSDGAKAAYEAAPVAKHEYHTISDHEDDDFATPLDLGPSLMDEVFSELDSSKDSNEKKPEETHPTKQHEMKIDLKDFVSTLTLNRTKNKKKQATVKPIKASDEKTLESAIALANALASKSMHDLDKRCVDDFYESSPAQSPLTPNSPTKKFKFLFPGRSSPKGERHKPFYEDIGQDAESSLSPGARDAYKALIEGHSDKEPSPAPVEQSSNQFNFSSHHRFSLPPSSSVFASHSSHRLSSFQPSIPESHPDDENPLPLPPKSKTLSNVPAKRHIRKNPLIIPSGTAANLLRREAVQDTEHFDLQVEELPSQHSSSHSVPSYTSTTNHSGKLRGAFDEADAFENEIAYSMDALDNIPDIQHNSPKQSLDLGKPDVSELDSAFAENNVYHRHKRGMDSDEVKVMKKVLGRNVDSSEACIRALDATDWNVHHAIKLIKIKNLIKVPHLSDEEMKMALQTRDWDIAKAANVLIKKMRE